MRNWCRFKHWLGCLFVLPTLNFCRCVWLIRLKLLRIIIYFCSTHCRGEGKKAADCLRTALRDYNLKFSTILNDPDLASFRTLPEFRELQDEVGVVIKIVPCSFMWIILLPFRRRISSFLVLNCFFSWLLLACRLELEVKTSDMDFKGISSLLVRFKHHFVV